MRETASLVWVAIREFLRLGVDALGDLTGASLPYAPSKVCRPEVQTRLLRAGWLGDPELQPRVDGVVTRYSSEVGRKAGGSGETSSPEDSSLSQQRTGTWVTHREDLSGETPVHRKSACR